MPDIPDDLLDEDAPAAPAPAEVAKAPPPVHPETVAAYRPDGLKIDLTPTAAQAAFQAGKVGFPQGDRVPVKLADGRVGTVAGGSLAGALQKGASLISPADQHQAEVEKQYGGALGALGAGALGVARGGSFGLSDVAGKALLGDQYTEAAEGLKDVHPLASGLGEAGGMIGLGALTGGSSALEEGAEFLGSRALGEGLAGRLGARRAVRRGRGGIPSMDAVEQRMRSPEATTSSPRRRSFLRWARTQDLGARWARRLAGGEPAGGMGKRGLGSLLGAHAERRERREGRREPVRYVPRVSARL